jgi:transcriptional regulator with XRE-family HTH domain
MDFGYTIPEWTLGDRLRKARMHAGMTGDQLAAAIGISAGTVVNYENGHTKVKRIVLLAWARETGVDPVWLRFGESTQ